MTDPASVTAAYPSPPNYSSPPAQKLSPGSWDRFGTMSLSPEAYGSKSPQPPGGGYGSTSSQDKSPLSTLNLSFLKSLTEKRTTRGKQPAVWLCLQAGDDAGRSCWMNSW